MTKNYTYEQLFEKLVRAKVYLENSRQGHSDFCPVECDPEGYSPCTCGAYTRNHAIDRALEALKL